MTGDKAAIVRCPNCGQRNRVRAAAEAPPHCGKCGHPLPWLADATSADFAAIVEQSPLPVLVDFWAPWCGPCRIVAPAVESLAGELAGRLKVARVNTDQEPALASRFAVAGLPTLMLFERGRTVDRVTGALGADPLRRWLAGRLSPSGTRAAS